MSNESPTVVALKNLLAKEQDANRELKELLVILADQTLTARDGLYEGQYSTRVNVALGRV